MILFQTVSLDYSSSHFALQLCCRIFVVWSLPPCGRLSVAWHRIVDIMTCYSRCWVFRIARTVWRFGLLVSSSNWTLVSSIYWAQIWIFPSHNRSYCLGSWFAPSSSILAQHMIWHFSLIRFFVCQTYAVTLLELCMFETGKESSWGDCTAGCRFFTAVFVVSFVVCLSFFWCSCLDAPLCNTIVTTVKHVFKRNLTCLIQLLNCFPPILFYHVSQLFID